LHPNNKILQELEQNEENRYLDTDSNKTKINYTKKPRPTRIPRKKKSYK
jgi:hypothetical protein